MRSTLAFGLFLVVVALGSSGCTLQFVDTTHGDWLAELQQLEAGRERLPLRVGCVARSDEEGQRYRRAAVVVVREALRDSPFTVADYPTLKDDLLVRISLRSEQKGGVLGVLGLLTLFVIPAKFDHTLTLHIEFVDRDDAIVRQYRRSGTGVGWLGWIFIIWGPAVSDKGADFILVRDMVRDIVREIYEKDYDFFRDLAKVSTSHDNGSLRSKPR